MAHAGESGEDADVTCNQVALVGRVAATAVERELPSGDKLVSLRLVVNRVPSRRRRAEAARSPSVDTLDCVAFLAGPRRTALTLSPGDVVAVDGALHRRFWRSPTGVSSRYEVEMSSVRRLRRAAAPDDASAQPSTSSR